MSNLVKRLREAQRQYVDDDYNLHARAADRIKELEYALRSIAEVPIGKEIPDRTTAWGLAFHMQQTAKDVLKEKQNA
jgi:hypothetical protein